MLNQNTHSLYLHKELTARIIGASFRVRRALGPGFLEHVYRNALQLELGDGGLRSRKEVGLPVMHNGRLVGECFADLVVEELVVVETKAVEAIRPGHLFQLHAYLRCSGLETGLVLNFGPTRVDVKRVAATRGTGDVGGGKQAG